MTSVTPELDALLKSIITNPDDDHARLLYADALDELPTMRCVCHACKGKNGWPWIERKEFGGESRGWQTCGVCKGTGEVLDRFPTERAEFIRVQVRLGQLSQPRKKLSGESIFFERNKVYFNVYGVKSVRANVGERVDVLNTTARKGDRPVLYGVLITKGDDRTSFFEGIIDAESVEENVSEYNELVGRETHLLELMKERGLLTGRETYRRGFMESWTGTAEEWLKIESNLFWHPDQVMGGANDVVLTPRPCPPSAHPLRKVMITSGRSYFWGKVGDLGRARGVEVSTFGGGDTGVVSLWPGLEITLPEYATDEGTEAASDDNEEWDDHEVWGGDS